MSGWGVVAQVVVVVVAVAVAAGIVWSSYRISQHHRYGWIGLATCLLVAGLGVLVLQPIHSTAPAPATPEHARR